MGLIYCGYQNVTGEKCKLHFSPTGDRTWSAGLKSPTLYHVTIKAGLYFKTVQVCYILILGDTILHGALRAKNYFGPG